MEVQPHHVQQLKYALSRIHRKPLNYGYLYIPDSSNDPNAEVFYLGHARTIE